MVLTRSSTLALGAKKLDRDRDTMPGTANAAPASASEREDSPSPSSANASRQPRLATADTEDGPDNKEEEGDAAAKPAGVEDDEEVQPVEKQTSSTETKAKPRKERFSFKGFLSKFALCYILIAYFYVCPSDPTRSPRVCSTLAYTHQCLAPHINHSIDIAQSKISPYVAKADPYISPLVPYYRKADALSRPALSRACSAYKAYVHPRLVNVLRALADCAAPHLRSVRLQIDSYADVVYMRHVAPHLNLVTSPARQGYSAVHERIQPAYDALAPVVVQVWQEHAQPGAKLAYAWSYATFHSTVKPRSQQAFAWSCHTYIREVHPRLLRLWERAVQSVRTRLLPGAKRWYSVYVNPQLDRVLQKMDAYRVLKLGKEGLADARAHEAEAAKAEGVDDVDEFLEELKAENLERERPQNTPTAPAPRVKTPEEIAQKRRTIEAMRDQAETDLAILIDKERVAFASRINHMRDAVAADLPNRFTAKISELEREAGTLIQRFERYFEKAARSEYRSLADKLEEAELIGRKAGQRLKRKVEDAKEEADGYGRREYEKEQDAIRQAWSPVEEMYQGVQGRLGIELTWLDGVTYADWQRYHALAKTANKFKAELNDLQQGLDKSHLLRHPDLFESFHALKVRMDEIQASFEQRLQRVASTGNGVLKGLPIEVPEAAPSLDHAAMASVVSTDSSAADMSDSASVGGGALPTPETAAAPATVNYSDAADAVHSSIRSPEVQNTEEAENTQLAGSSPRAEASNEATEVLEALPDAGSSDADNVRAPVESVYPDAAEAIGTAYGDASQDVSNLEHASSPNDLNKPAQSAAAAVAEGVGSVLTAAMGDPATASDYASLADGATSASESEAADGSERLIKAMDGTPLPTQLQQAAESLSGEASRAIPEALDAAALRGSAPGSASSSADAVGRGAASTAEGTLSSPDRGQAARQDDEQVEKRAQEALRRAEEAVGALRERVEL